MYCINCGVKLADTEKVCPLCNTRVYHPDLTQGEAEPSYPDRDRVINRGRNFAYEISFTVLCLITIVTVLLCDIRINGIIGWSGFVIGAIVTGYVFFILPYWFEKPNPVIFIPCGFVSLILYLLYICLITGGKWFLGFAFPVTGGICLIVTAVAALYRYVKRGRLYICGGAIIAFGGHLLLTEFLTNITFDVSRFIGWSLYPLAVLTILGGFLIFLAICRPAREMMERKFFF